MNIQSILIGTDIEDFARVYMYLLTDEKLISIELCERENVGLMGWWPVKGKILDTENPKELYELIRFDANMSLLNCEEFASVADFRKKFGKYVQVIDGMKVENDSVTLPGVGGIEYGFITPVTMGKVQFSKDEE